MSTTCPGQLALIPEGMQRYMRVSCMTFWMDAEPDLTIFYLHKEKVELTVPGIAKLEARLAALLAVEYPQFIKLKYVGYEMIGMTDQDVVDAGGFYVVGLEP